MNSISITIRKMVSLFLVIVLVFALSACSGDKSNSKAEDLGETKLKLGICISNFDDTWNQYMMTAMRNHAEKLGVEIVMLDSKEDTAKQIEQIEGFVLDEVDAVIITPVNTSAVKTISETVIPKGIPLVYVNRYPDPLPEEAYYVGSNEKEAGLIQGEFLRGYLQPGDKVAILMGKLDEEASPKRTEGVESIIEELGGVVVEKNAGNWFRPEGMRITEDWITKYGDDLKAICANNDDMALGAIQALEAAKMLDQVMVLGIDATPDAIALIKEGKLAGSVFQDAKGQGEAAIDVALGVIRGENPQQETWIPFEKVGMDNVEDFEGKY